MGYKKNIVKLKDLAPNMKSVYIDNAEVVEIGELQEKEKDGKKIQFITAKIIDDSVTEPINLTAWGFAANFLKDAKVIQLQNCFAKLYENPEEKISRIELTTGFFGKLTRIS